MNGFKLWLLMITLLSMFASNVLSQIVPIKAPIHANDSQNSGSPTSLFVDFGIGKAPGLFKGNGTSAAIFLYFSKRKNTISFRTLGNMEYIFRAGPAPVESYSDLSVLWGHKLFSQKYRSIIPMIGAGKITSIKRGKLLDENSVDPESVA